LSTPASHPSRAPLELFRRERDHLASALEGATGRFGLFELGALITVAVSLTAMNFLGSGELYISLWSSYISPSSPDWELGHLAHWVGACTLGYLIIPLTYLKLTGRVLSDYYWSPRGLSEHKWVYVTLLLPASALVYWVSFWPDFQRIYPFYSEAGRSWRDLIVWELLYGLQFFSLEFFFRAFMLEALRKSLSYGAVAVMIIPYCMVHFQKTAAESLGSIVAGLLLGYLAMRSRSLWGGVLVHWLIAVEMDVFSLMQTDRLPPLP
jgi:membrane protease YdiL (CAAX protease family)